MFGSARHGPQRERERERKGPGEKVLLRKKKAQNSEGKLTGFFLLKSGIVPLIYLLELRYKLGSSGYCCCLAMFGHNHAKTKSAEREKNKQMTRNTETREKV